MFFFAVLQFLDSPNDPLKVQIVQELILEQGSTNVHCR